MIFIQWLYRFTALYYARAMPLTEQEIETYHRDEYTLAQVINGGTFSKLGLDLLRENAAFEPWREACQLLQKQLAASD